MSQLTFQTRPRNRLRATTQPARTVDLVAPAPRAVPVAPPVSEPPPMISVLEYMSRKNPALRQLVQAFDLVETGPGYNIAANGFPAGVNLVPTLLRLQATESNTLTPLPEVAPATKVREPMPGLIDKLRSIAHRALPDCDSWSYEGTVDRIAETTNVSIDRAKSGLDLMLTYQLIATTPGGTYYRSDTTPF